VSGKASLGQTELDRVVAAEPPQPLGRIWTGGKATVKGANRTQVALPNGSAAYVVHA